MIKIKTTKTEELLIIALLFMTIFNMGAVCNYVVTNANHGEMPFYSDYEYYYDDHHVSFSDYDAIKYPLLADIFTITGFGHYLQFSLGDFLVTLGILGVATSFVFFIIFKRREYGKGNY